MYVFVLSFHCFDKNWHINRKTMHLELYFQFLMNSESKMHIPVYKLISVIQGFLSRKACNFQATKILARMYVY